MTVEVVKPSEPVAMEVDASAQTERPAEQATHQTTDPPYLPKTAERWERLMWRLDRELSRVARETMQMTAKGTLATQKQIRQGRSQEPTPEQRWCLHNVVVKGANQYARWEKCKLCNLRLSYESKVGGTRNRGVPGTGACYSPPTPSPTPSTTRTSRPPDQTGRVDAEAMASLEQEAESQEVPRRRANASTRLLQAVERQTAMIAEILRR